MMHSQISIRKLLLVVFVVAVIILIAQKRKQERFSDWAVSGPVTYPSEVPSIAMSKYGISSTNAAIAFIVIQSDSMAGFLELPGSDHRGSVVFRGTTWYFPEDRFKLVVIIDEKLKFSGVIDEPWIAKHFQRRAEISTDDVWKIVDHVGAR